MNTNLLHPMLVAAVLASSASLAFAEEATPRATPAIVGSAIDPNTFIVGHPASPSWKRAHSHAEHPAVQLRQRGEVKAIDSNAFRVQPPVGVRWVLS